MEQFSMKEIYDVSLKATYPMRIKNRDYEIGEVITIFDKIQISTLEEIKRRVAATGGYDNRARVIWEDTRQIDFSFTQGIFSEIQLAMLGNSRLIEKEKGTNIVIAKREILESDENGEIELKEKPFGGVYIYICETGEKLKEYELKEKTLVIPNKYTDVIVDYNYNYTNGGTDMIIGRRLIDGFVFLEGKTKVKEDITGIDRTGILKIPKLKLMSDISIKLGTKANPVNSNFLASCFPIGDKGSKKVMELVFLNDDIDSDI